MVVPLGAPISSNAISSPPSIAYLTPVIVSVVLVISSVLDTAAILASASPLKPRLRTDERSSELLILLVACLKKAHLISSFAIPQPLSVTLISDIPPSLISSVICVAPESIAFSRSSLTTEAGLSITSPAAILFIVSLSSSFITDMY